MTIRPDKTITTQLSSYEMMLWSLQLHVMYSAGVPLMSALESVAKSEEPRLSVVCHHLIDRVNSGYRLSQAMESLNPAFGLFLINMVAIGEETGNLSIVFDRARYRAERKESTQREIRAALAYPLVLTVVSIAMALFMGLYMFPQLLPLLTNLKVELPWPTRALVWIVDNLSSSILLVTIITIWLTQLLVSGSDPRVSKVRQWLLYESPVLGPINHDRMQAELLNDLSLLLIAGSDLVRGLRTLRVSQDRYQERIQLCIEALKSGSNFTDAVRESQLLSERYLLQIASAEETGSLATACAQISKFLDESVRHRTKALVQLIEPIVLGGMGLVTGFIILATFMPLYSMASFTF